MTLKQHVQRLEEAHARITKATGFTESGVLTGKGSLLETDDYLLSYLLKARSAFVQKHKAEVLQAAAQLVKREIQEAESWIGRSEAQCALRHETRET